MNILRRFVWLSWFLSLILLVLVLFSFPTVEVILFTTLFVIIGYLLNSQTDYRKKTKKISNIIDKIDFDPIQKELDEIKRNNLDEIESLHKEFEKYKEDQEKKYDDVVKKVLKMDNEMRKKINLLGDCVLKINKELEKTLKSKDI